MQNRWGRRQSGQPVIVAVVNNAKHSECPQQDLEHILQHMKNMILWTSMQRMQRINNTEDTKKQLKLMRPLHKRNMTALRKWMMNGWMNECQEWEGGWPLLDNITHAFTQQLHAAPFTLKAQILSAQTRGSGLLYYSRSTEGAVKVDGNLSWQSGLWEPVSR